MSPATLATDGDGLAAGKKRLLQSINETTRKMQKALNTVRVCVARRAARLQL